jgi:hypothetical protein
VPGFDTPKALAKAMAKAAADMRALDEASAQLGASLVGLARGRAPMGRTGNLRASVAFRVTRPGKGLDSQVRVTAGSPSVPYAAPIHWGWPARNIAPNYYLTDPLGRMVDHDVIDQAYADKVSEILTRALT